MIGKNAGTNELSLFTLNNWKEMWLKSSPRMTLTVLITALALFASITACKGEVSLFYELDTGENNALEYRDHAPEKAGSNSSFGAGVLRSRLAGIDRSVLYRAVEGELENIKFNFFADIDYKGKVNKVIDRGGERFSITGELEGSFSSFVISVYDEAVSGTLRTGDGGIYELKHLGEGVFKIEEIDPYSFPESPLDTIKVELKQDSETGFDINSPMQEEGTAGDPMPTEAGDTVIDVLVVYTPSALSSAGGESEMLALIDSAIDDTNIAYQNSNINVTLNLVHAEQVSYTEFSYQTDLSRLRVQGDGYLDYVHTLREIHSADMVSMVINNYQSCGMAYQMTYLSPDFADYAFSVVHIGCAVSNHSFAHELGHNFGCDHAVGDGEPPLERDGSAIYNYAYGWRFGYDQYRTIMAYSPGMRVGHFSNPYVFYAGYATGQPTFYADSAYNAKVINNTAPTVAMFRDVSCPPVDTNGDCSIDLYDLLKMGGQWMKTGCYSSDIAPIGAPDGIVNYKDLALLAKYWKP